MYQLGDYSLRPIKEEDLRMILEWRNSERIHAVMLTNHKITWDEHYAWFLRQKDNHIKRNLVFEYKGKPIGYVGYTEYDEENATCSPGAYIGDENGAPAEAGFLLFYMAMDYAFFKLEMKVLKTDILADNKKAMRLDKFLGYEINKTESYFMQKNEQNIKVEKAYLTLESWIEKKEDLKDFVRAQL